MSSVIDRRTDKEKEIDLRYKRRVLKGIALLEEKYGKDWADLGQEAWDDLFDIRDASACVLGGIAKDGGDYYTEVRRLHLSESDAADHGFSLYDAEVNTNKEETAWRSLQRLWVKEMRARGVRVTE